MKIITKRPLDRDRNSVADNELRMISRVPSKIVMGEVSGHFFGLGKSEEEKIPFHISH